MADKKDPLEELHAAVATTTDLLYLLRSDSEPAQFRELAAQLERCASLARHLSASEHEGTGCKRHPGGPVDPEATSDEERCLLCNTYRRRGRPASRGAHVRRGPERRSPGGQ